MGVTLGAVLILLGMFNITAFIVQDTNPPTWQDQAQSLDAADHGATNTLSACWKDNETYVPKAKLETTVDSEVFITEWQDTVPLTTEGSVLVGIWTPGVDGPTCDNNPVGYCLHFEDVDTEKCNIIFKPQIPQCECWCTGTIVLCNASTFDYEVPETCSPVSWRIFGKDVAGNENVTDSMSFDVNDVTEPTYGSLKQGKAVIDANETNELSVVCMDKCGLSKATLWTKENSEFEEKESQEISGTQQKVIFEWINPGLSDQEVEWKIVCEDQEGNKGETIALSFSIGEADDTEAPELVDVSIDNDSPKKGETITVTATWRDNKGLSSAQLEINGAVVSTKSMTGTSDSATFMWTSTEHGQYTWSVRATDTSGNSAASEAEMLIVEGICPTCMNPSEWSRCVKGQQSRTVYECSAETDYRCAASMETRECAAAAIEIPMWLIVSFAAVIAGIGIVAFVTMKKPAAAAVTKYFK